MCFWSEAEKVHFGLSSEHDAPVCGRFRKHKRAESFISETACGVAKGLTQENV